LPLEELKSNKRIIGTKQVNKALNRGIVKKVYIASDAESHIIQPTKELCRLKQVEVEMVDNMKNLGKACGIDVGSATVALLDI